jgi:hypothetical protein
MAAAGTSEETTILRDTDYIWNPGLIEQRKAKVRTPPDEACQYDPQLRPPKTVEMLRKCRSVSRMVEGPDTTFAGTNLAVLTNH